MTSPPPPPRPASFAAHLPVGKPFSRRKKVLLCLTLVVAIVVGLGSIFLSIMEMLRTSDATGNAVDLVDASAACTRWTGRPLRVGWLIMGNIHVVNDRGDADLVIPVTGPNGGGEIYAVEYKRAGVWYVTSVAFQPDGQSDSNRVILAVPNAH